MAEKQNIFKVNRFYNILSFLSHTRMVLSLICVRQNGIAMENYPAYGFVRDVIGLLIAEAKDIQSIPDLLSLAEQTLPSGINSFEELVAKLETEKLDNLTFTGYDEEWSDLPMEELERRVSEMASKETATRKPRAKKETD